MILEYLSVSAALLGALALLILNLSTTVKNRVDMTRQRVEIQKINHEMQPNSGESLRDAINATLRRVESMEGSLGGFRRDTAEQFDGIRRDMRLNRETTLDLGRDKRDAHAEIAARLNRLEHPQ